MKYVPCIHSCVDLIRRPEGWFCLPGGVIFVILLCDFENFAFFQKWTTDPQPSAMLILIQNVWINTVYKFDQLNIDISMYLQIKDNKNIDRIQSLQCDIMIICAEYIK